MRERDKITCRAEMWNGNGVPFLIIQMLSEAKQMMRNPCSVILSEDLIAIDKLKLSDVD